MKLLRKQAPIHEILLLQLSKQAPIHEILLLQLSK